MELNLKGIIVKEKEIEKYDKKLKDKKVLGKLLDIFLEKNESQYYLHEFKGEIKKKNGEIEDIEKKLKFFCFMTGNEKSNVLGYSAHSNRVVLTPAILEDYAFVEIKGAGYLGAGIVDKLYRTTPLGGCYLEDAIVEFDICEQVRKKLPRTSIPLGVCRIDESSLPMDCQTFFVNRDLGILIRTAKSPLRVGDFIYPGGDTKGFAHFAINVTMRLANIDRDPTLFCKGDRKDELEDYIQNFKKKIQEKLVFKDYPKNMYGGAGDEEFMEFSKRYGYLMGENFRKMFDSGWVSGSIHPINITSEFELTDFDESDSNEFNGFKKGRGKKYRFDSLGSFLANSFLCIFLLPHLNEIELRRYDLGKLVDAFYLNFLSGISAMNETKLKAFLSKDAIFCDIWAKKWNLRYYFFKNRDLLIDFALKCYSQTK